MIAMYSFYKCCKEQPKALIEMIKYVGSKMSKEMYQFIAFNRANTEKHNNKDEAELLYSLYEELLELEKKLEEDINYKNNKDKIKKAKIDYVKYWLNANKSKTSGTHIDEDHLEDIISRARKAYKNIDIISDKGIDELTAAAFTFWVTKAEFFGTTDPYKVGYIFDRDNGENTEEYYLGVTEKKAIEKATDSGARLVRRIHDQMEKNDIIVENLDYKELIKKYNGKEYIDISGITINEYKSKIEEAFKKLELLKDDGTLEVICDSEYNGIDDIEEYTYSEEAERILEKLKDDFSKSGKLSLDLLTDTVCNILNHYNELINDKDKLVYYYRIYMKDHLHQEKTFEDQNKLWYMDPPYHPATLGRGVLASYEETFNAEMAKEMVKILHNDEVDTYGKLEYFLKSDYSPKYNKIKDEEVVEETTKKLEEEERSTRPDKERITILKKHIAKHQMQIECCKDAYHDFDILEENDLASSACKKDENGNFIAEKVEYYVDLLGDFSKGTSDSMSDDKKKGTEFLWCRGNYSIETAGVYRDGVLIEQKQEEQ